MVKTYFCFSDFAYVDFDFCLTICFDSALELMMSRGAGKFKFASFFFFFDNRKLIIFRVENMEENRNTDEDGKGVIKDRMKHSIS